MPAQEELLFQFESQLTYLLYLQMRPMAAAVIPPALKAADIARFAQRAGQLEKARPAVAYWCQYTPVTACLSPDRAQAITGSLIKSLQRVYIKPTMTARGTPRG